MRNNPNGRRHLAEVTRAKKERTQLAQSIGRLLGEHYSRRELIKIFYMVYEGREIRFGEVSCISVSDPLEEKNMPAPLRDILARLYPPKEIPEVDDTIDGLL